MSEPQKDTQRAVAAAKLILDGRDPTDSSVLVTLEGLVALVLLAVMKQDEHKAARILNEGLVPGVEERLSLHASRTQ